MNPYFLVFSSHFDYTKGIEIGRLLLENIKTGNKHIWKFWSSHKNGQSPNSIHKRGGYLPPSYRIPSVPQLRVSTTPIDLSHHKGVKGNFYPILPFEFVTDKGGKRGDFGIHLDANVPGSAGCPVTNAKRFAKFENAMTELRAEGIKDIPLIVVYS